MSLGPLTKVEVTPSPGALAELAEFLIAAPEGEPKLVGYYDRRGKLRRIMATYPDGTRCRININAGAFVTSSRTELPTISLRGSDAQG
ncbi:hypothetical protein [Erythrobacter colymbi]|uniref:hypothetical protein n=1 Tax=Erythrobacter colymbi TaxID=1161202 RepID=UPI000A3C09B2|nr:hypothetical protein [Erythrobacter colymbi]